MKSKSVSQPQTECVRTGNTCLLQVSDFAAQPLRFGGGSDGNVVILLKTVDQEISPFIDPGIIYDQDTVVVSLAGVLSLCRSTSDDEQSDVSQPVNVTWQDSQLPTTIDEWYLATIDPNMKFMLRTLNGQPLAVGQEFYLQDEIGYLRYNADDDSVGIYPAPHGGIDPTELPDLVRFHVHGTDQGLEVVGDSRSTTPTSMVCPDNDTEDQPLLQHSNSTGRPTRKVVSKSKSIGVKGIAKSAIPRSQSDSMLHKEGRNDDAMEVKSAEGAFVDELGDFLTESKRPFEYSNARDAEFSVTFEDGPLGVILKRNKEHEFVFVQQVAEEAQACELGLQAGDILCQVGDTDLRDWRVGKEEWAEFVDFIVKSPRPLHVIWLRLPDEESKSEAESKQEVCIQPEPTVCAPPEPLVCLPPEEDEGKKKLRELQDTIVFPNDKKQKKITHLVETQREVLLDVSIPAVTRGMMWNTLTPKRLVLLPEMLIVTAEAAHGAKANAANKKKRQTYQVEFSAELATCKIDVKLDSSAHDFDVIMPTGAVTFVASSGDLKKRITQKLFTAICAAVEAQGSGHSLGWRHQIRLGTLHSAVLSRQAQKVRELLAALADTDLANEQDVDGYSALHYACITRQNQLIDILAKAGADIGMQDNDGFTAIHWSALQLEDEALTILGAHIDEVDQTDFAGKTALFRACVNGATVTGDANAASVRRCIQALQCMGANLNAQDLDGFSILHHLAASWRHEILEILLESVGDPDQRVTTTRQTPLHLACACLPLPESEAETSKMIGSRRLVRSNSAAATNEAMPELRDISATLKVLLMAGTRPNLRDANGKTALVLLAEQCQQANFAPKLLDGVRQLLAHGARFDDHPIEDVFKKTSLNVSEMTEDWRLKPVLTSDSVSIISNDKWSDGLQTNPEDPKCLFCDRDFNFFRRQHHCRFCGLLVCNPCSNKSIKKRENSLRACDACYNRLFYKLKRAQKEVKRPSSSSAAATAAAQATTEANHVKAPSKDDKMDTASQRAALFGDAKAKDSAEEQQRRSTSSAAAAAQGGLGGLKDTLGETHERLAERGEKLSQLSEKTGDLANAAAEFAKMARQLREQQEQQSRWW